MLASPLVVVGLGAFAAQASAWGGIDTVIDTAVITITSCGPEVESCPGKTLALATSEVTETSTYCPPTVATTAPGVVLPKNSMAATYAAPTGNASSVTIKVSELTSATPATPVAPITAASNLSSIATSPPTSVHTSAPVGPPSYSNSTLTAPNLPGSDTSILTAPGSPSTLTSVVVVPPTATPHESSPTSASSATPKATGPAGRLVVPGIMLGLLAIGAILLNDRLTQIDVNGGSRLLACV